MYRRILVALENSRADDSLVPHVSALAKLTGAELLLVHVADGFAARHFDRFQLAESEEIKADRDYLEHTAAPLRESGLTVEVELALGEPPVELVKVAEAHGCDLMALASHGHRLLGDIFLGSTIDKVRHHTSIPLLIVRASAVGQR